MRWIATCEIGGRRRRTTDPNLAEDVWSLLMKELMSARRAVKSALDKGDPAMETVARKCVNDAKVALGERGPSWREEAGEAFAQVRRSATRRALRRARARETN